MVPPSATADPGGGSVCLVFAGATKLAMGFIQDWAVLPTLVVWGAGEGLLAETLPSATPASGPQPTTSRQNEAPWERKRERLWGLAFLGSIPIKTETGLQSQQKTLACQTAAIRLRRIYGVCDSQGGVRVLAGR